MPIIAPSLLASNFLRLEDEAKMLNESQADWFHLDVMDGRFVPNISKGEKKDETNIIGSGYDCFCTVDINATKFFHHDNV